MKLYYYFVAQTKKKWQKIGYGLNLRQVLKVHRKDLDLALQISHRHEHRTSEISWIILCQAIRVVLAPEIPFFLYWMNPLTTTLTVHRGVPAVIRQTNHMSTKPVPIQPTFKVAAKNHHVKVATQNGCKK